MKKAFPGRIVRVGDILVGQPFAMQSAMDLAEKLDHQATNSYTVYPVLESNIDEILRWDISAENIHPNTAAALLLSKESLAKGMTLSPKQQVYQYLGINIKKVERGWIVPTLVEGKIFDTIQKAKAHISHHRSMRK